MFDRLEVVMKESMKLLELEGISKGFPGVKALDNVDFDVEAGEVHVLMGENGAGKVRSPWKGSPSISRIH